MVLLTRGPKSDQIHRDRRRVEVTRGWGRGRQESMCNGDRASVWEMRKFWRCRWGFVQNDVIVLYAINCTLKMVSFVLCSRSDN